MERSVFLGLDIGSTTAKLALVAADGKLLEAQYLRHGAAVRQTLSTMLDQLALKYPGMAVSAAITGSASLGLSETLGLPFVQEVVAASRAIAVLARKPMWPWNSAAKTPRSSTSAKAWICA